MRELTIESLAKVVEISNVLYLILVAAGRCARSYALHLLDLVLQPLVLVKVLQPLLVLRQLTLLFQHIVQVQNLPDPLHVPIHVGLVRNPGLLYEPSELLHSLLVHLLVALQHRKIGCFVRPIVAGIEYHVAVVKLSFRLDGLLVVIYFRRSALARDASRHQRTIVNPPDGLLLVDFCLGFYLYHVLLLALLVHLSQRKLLLQEVEQICFVADDEEVLFAQIKQLGGGTHALSCALPWNLLQQLDLPKVSALAQHLHLYLNHINCISL